MLVVAREHLAVFEMQMGLQIGPLPALVRTELARERLLPSMNVLVLLDIGQVRGFVATEATTVHFDIESGLRDTYRRVIGVSW